MPSSLRVRFWCFTVFLPDLNEPGTEDPPDGLNPELWPGCRYCIYQLEMSDTGRLHYQGYADFKNPITRGGIQKLEGMETAHLEPRRGTDDQARNYCLKEDTRVDGPFEFGQFVASGQRTDCEAVHKYWEDHPEATSYDMYQKFPRYGFYHGGNLERIEKWKEERKPPRKFKTKVTFLYGESGCGKTRWAEAYTADKKTFSKEPDSKWFDGYRGEEITIIDDFKGEINYTKMLRLMDRYACKVEVKGGTKEFVSKEIVLTASMPPWDWYATGEKRNPFNWKEFSRRVDVFLVPHPVELEAFIQISAEQFYSLYSETVPRSTETDKLIAERNDLFARSYHMLAYEVDQYNKAVNRSILLDKQRAALPLRKNNQPFIEDML